MPPATLLSVVLLATIGVGVVAALLAWRERPEPGSLPLVVMLAGQCWWSAFLLFQIDATSLHEKLLWVYLSWVGVVVIPVAWLLFALEYTGRDRYVRTRYVTLLSIVPAITIVIALTGDPNHLLYVESTLVQEGGRTVIVQTGGPWFWIIAGYTYLLGALGSVPLLGVVRSDSVSFRGQGAALLVGTAVPWASNALFLLGAIPSGIDLTPVAFSISGVAYLGALTQFRLFGTNPAPMRNAHRLAFERMHDGALVADTHGYVVDLNDRLADVFDVEPKAALGRPASEFVPGFDELPDDGPAADHLTIHGETGDRFFDVTSTRIDDAHGRPIGRIVTFHDVGDYLRQQQRLEVLNRVLRHNIREETNLIGGYADLLGNGRREGLDDLIKERAERIEEMGEMAREIAELFERRETSVGAVPIDGLVEPVLESVRAAYPTVAIECDRLPDDVRVSGVLRPVFENVLENAAQHNTSDDPRVRVEVEVDDDRVRVVVSDNGPGISPYERAVLERGAETPLEHGSGLGLWLIQWGVGIADGNVRFEENDPTGSVVTVEVPVLRTGHPIERDAEPSG